MCRLQSWLKLISTANVTIKHIHFKYEDADTSKGNEFVLGFAIDKIQINALSVRESRTSAWQHGRSRWLFTDEEQGKRQGRRRRASIHGSGIG